MHAFSQWYNYKYDTLDNLLGEMLTNIRALADHFLMALPNVNKHFWCRCRGERRFAEITLSLAIILYYTFILLFFYPFIFSIFMDNSNSTPIIEFLHLRRPAIDHGSQQVFSLPLIMICVRS